MTKKKKKKLTVKEQKFVEYYSGNATEACIQAGYSGDRKAMSALGCRMMKKEHIQEALEKKSKERVPRREVLTREEIIENLSDIADNPKAPDVARISALEKLAKMHGMFQDGIEDPISRLDSMTDQELGVVLMDAVAGFLITTGTTIEQLVEYLQNKLATTEVPQ